MHCVALKFYPNQKNPARASGRGVYRVEIPLLAWIPEDPAIGVERLGPGKTLVIRTTTHVKRGSRVDPLKLALAGVLDSGRGRA